MSQLHVIFHLTESLRKQIMFCFHVNIFYIGIKQTPIRTTIIHIQPILQALDNSIKNCETLLPSTVDNIYNDIISVLATGANNFVPARQKNFYKFWWDRSSVLSKKWPLSQTDSGKHQVNPVKDLFSTNVKHVGPNTAKPYERVRNSVPQVTQTPFMRHC